MINSTLLRDKPLYAKWKDTLPHYKDHIEGAAFNASCNICQSEQTFTWIRSTLNGKDVNYFGMGGRSRITGEPDVIKGVLLLIYRCAKCEQQYYNYLLNVKEDGSLEKVGQTPELECEIPKEISEFGGEVLALYRKGRISENHGYGIGAFAYYRRIVEKVIDDLIEAIKEIVPTEARKDYEEVIREAKAQKYATDKLRLVQDVVVDTSIEGNPLAATYKLLSVGLHNLNDVQCLEYAQSLRTLLTYLLKKTSNAKKEKIDVKKALDAVNKIHSEISRRKNEQ